MAQITVLTILPSVTTPAYVACSGGGDFYLPVGLKTLVHVKSTHSSPQTVTVNDPTSIAPVGAKTFDPDVDFIIPNAAERMFVIDPVRFTNPANGRVEITYSGVTLLTIAVFTLS